MDRKRTFPTLAALLPLVVAGCGGGGGTPTNAVESDGAVNETGFAGAQVDAPGTGEVPETLTASTGSPFSLDDTPERSEDVASEGDDGSVRVPPMGDDGPDGQAPVGDGDDTDALIGLWDYTRSTDEGDDVALFSIEANGVVSEYDYRDDAVGDGRPCHVVNVVSIASRGNDRYGIQSSSTLPGAGSIDDVLITATGDEITFRYLGEVFDPEFGGGQTGITETYPAVTDRRVEELEICER